MSERNRELLTENLTTQCLTKLHFRRFTPPNTGKERSGRSDNDNPYAGDNGYARADVSLTLKNGVGLTRIRVVSTILLNSCQNHTD